MVVVVVAVVVVVVVISGECLGFGNIVVVRNTFLMNVSGFGVVVVRGLDCALITLQRRELQNDQK